MTIQSSTGGFKRALVIDDSIDARLLLDSFFRTVYPGIEVRLYDPLQEGSPAADFDWCFYDVLILDVDLGNGENGLDWLRVAREHGTVPATVLLTAHGDEELVVRALKSGVHEYLSKRQLTVGRLREAVSAALAEHARELERAEAVNYRHSILNTPRFYRSLGRAIAQALPGSPTALFLVRVNDFAHLQARLGLLESDVLAANISDAIYSACAPDHQTLSVTRIGDGTVAALVPGTEDLRAVRVQADALCRAAVAVHAEIADVSFTVSVGAVVIAGGNAGQSPDVWLARADAACRVAARGNDSAFHVDVDGGTSGCSSTNEVAFAMDEAIRMDRVQVQYQQLVVVSESASSGGASFYQMSSQLVDTWGQVHTPSVVMKTADGERMLDRWMLRAAFVQLQLHAVGQPKLFSSLSQETLYDESFAKWIGALTKHIGRPELARSVIFEISPNALFADYARAVSNINRLRDTFGMSFALAQSSNVALFESCTRKVDFEFVRLRFDGAGNADEAQSDAFATAVTAAKAVDTLTIAERIANAAQLTVAVQSGADFVQGDFIQQGQDEIVDDPGLGGPGQLPTRGSHRAGRAELPHPVPQPMDSLRAIHTVYHARWG